MSTITPCVSCGACCATYRVVFSQHELASFPGGSVPVSHARMLDDRRACLLGTDRTPPRCVALEGEVGRRVGCAIYAQRPSPCRAFAPDAGIGRGEARCGDARRRHGLPPLGGSYDAIPLA
jgi:Fe-S-cluster containining protein